MCYGISYVKSCHHIIMRCSIKQIPHHKIMAKHLTLFTFDLCDYAKIENTQCLCIFGVGKWKMWLMYFIFTINIIYFFYDEEIRQLGKINY